MSENKKVVVDDKKRIKVLEDFLVYVRDNIVHGNEKHVTKINEVLEG